MIKTFQEHVSELNESTSVSKIAQNQRDYGQDIGQMAFAGLDEIVDALKTLGQHDPNGLMTIVTKIKQELQSTPGGEEAGQNLRTGARRFVQGATRMASPTPKPQANPVDAAL